MWRVDSGCAMRCRSKAMEVQRMLNKRVRPSLCNKLFEQNVKIAPRHNVISTRVILTLLFEIQLNLYIHVGFEHGWHVCLLFEQQITMFSIFKLSKAGFKC